MDDLLGVLTRMCGSDQPDLTMRQLAVLVYLGTLRAEDEPEKAVFQVVAQAIGMSKPAMTRTVTKLQEMGFIERQELERDLRQYWIQLTDAGRAYLRENGALMAPAVPAVPQPYLIVVDPSTRALQLVGPFASEDEGQRWRQGARNQGLPGEERAMVHAVPQIPVRSPADETKRLRAQTRLLPAA